SKASLVSWFPGGAGSSALAVPTPGSTIKANTPITLTFSKPYKKALGGGLPQVIPATQGTWHRINARSIEVRPEGYGYGPGPNVSARAPKGGSLVGPPPVGDPTGGTWKVPPGSNVRMQQLLAILGSLPLHFHYSGSSPGHTIAGQEAAAVKPPAGSFDWRYP